MRPPEDLRGGAGVCDEEAGEIGGHEREDEACDEAGFPRKLVVFACQPDGAYKKAADKQAGYGDGTEQGEGCGEVEIEIAEDACRIEEAEAKASGDVIKGDQREGEEGPEYEGVREAG